MACPKVLRTGFLPMGGIATLEEPVKGGWAVLWKWRGFESEETSEGSIAGVSSSRRASGGASLSRGGKAGANVVTVSGPGHSREYPAHAAEGHSGTPSPGPRLPVSPQGAALPESPVETEHWALPMRLAGPRRVWSCVLSMCCSGVVVVESDRRVGRAQSTEQFSLGSRHRLSAPQGLQAFVFL